LIADTLWLIGDGIGLLPTGVLVFMTVGIR